MKRVGGLWETVVSFGNLHEAARRASLGKRKRPDVAAFLLNAEAELVSLRRELESGEYHTGPYREFRVHEAKPRLISAAPFRERVVHHALTQALEPIFERRFSKDSVVGYFEFHRLDANRQNMPRWRCMQRRSRKEPEDEFQAGIMAVNRLTGEQPQEKPQLPKLTKSVVSQLMAQMGRKGGKIGGKRRAANMTEEQRSEAASLAARARWASKAKAS